MDSVFGWICRKLFISSVLGHLDGVCASVYLVAFFSIIIMRSDQSTYAPEDTSDRVNEKRP